MTSSACLKIRDGLVQHVSGNLTVTAVGEACVVSFPWQTPDRRYVEVWIETADDRLRVHDGGKSFAQLYVQGIHPTPERLVYFQRLAATYGLEYDDCLFRTLCRWPTLPSTVMRVAQCATLAMKSVISHVPSVERGTATLAVQRGLEVARKQVGGTIETNPRVSGRSSFHRFDYVLAEIRSDRAKTVAIKILRPTYSPKVEAERYGFTVLDLAELPAAAWPRVAVVTQAEKWKKPEVDLVRRLSQATLPIRSDEESSIELVVPESLIRLVA